VVLTGEITADLTLDARCLYRLHGFYKVRSGATLHVPAGTRIEGDKTTKGALVVYQGGRLEALGTPEAPIVFTSEMPAGTRNRGDWGGVVLMGRAPNNIPGGTGVAEGGEADWTYGGTNANDDSGILQYVRIEYAGLEVTPDNELNGLSLYSVGRGTTLEHIQIHQGLDDGLEFFGGTADVRYLLVTGAADDSVDWDQGFTGRGQFWIVQQEESEGDNAMECDNSGSDRSALPRSSPVVSNVTLIGQGPDLDSSEDNFGWLARNGTAGKVHNAILYGWDEAGLDIRDLTAGHALAGDLDLRTSIFFNNEADFASGTTDDSRETPAIDEQAWAMDASRANRTVDPMLGDPLDIAAPDFQPSASGPAASGGVVPSDSWFESVTFIGAVAPTGTPWYEGWTTTDVE
jgi:hypothetical protein